MSDRSNGLDDQEVEPVSQAVHQLALSLHDGIVSDLHLATDVEPLGYEERLAKHRKNYPQVLFGELAMHLAGIQLPAEATAPDRARAIVEALRCISQTPSLFEAITNAPYTQELASGIVPAIPKNIERDDKEIAEVIKLQKQVAERGYLEHSMIPHKRVVQLQYVTSPTAKPRRFSRDKPAEPAVITLKVVPTNKSGWEVKLYNKWDQFTGFTGYLGKREVNQAEVFNLIAVNSSAAKVPLDLTKLIGDTIKIDQVSTGTQLRITHNFTRPIQEVPGYEGKVSSQTLSIPATLKQAYLGDLTDYPLFP